MSCDRLRHEMAVNRTELPEDVRAHLRECSACRAFAERLDVARDLLRSHHGEVEPDAGFAGRVTARLRPEVAAEALGWAAARLLPVVLALGVVLAAFALRTAPQLRPGDAAANGSEGQETDYLEWILADAEDAS